MYLRNCIRWRPNRCECLTISGPSLTMAVAGKPITDANFTAAIADWADKGPSEFGVWCTGDVTNMQNAFEDMEAFNADIGAWDTAKVTTMEGMFSDATSFNQDIGDWDTRNVNMRSMRADFNQDSS